MTQTSNIHFRPSHSRGFTEIDWLKSWHSFSFGEYYDADHMGFGPLRVINEDIVAPGAGFPMHAHANMEIVTYVLAGALQHRDSLGNGDIIRPGDVQAMSAASGIHHSEFNPSSTGAVHLLQIWILPQARGGQPGYQQVAFDPAGAANQWQTLVTPDGADGTLSIRQDTTLKAVRLSAGASVDVAVLPQRKYWLQAARGHAILDGVAGVTELRAGDGLGLDHAEGRASLQATEDSELLLFDLPR